LANKAIEPGLKPAARTCTQIIHEDLSCQAPDYLASACTVIRLQ